MPETDRDVLTPPLTPGNWKVVRKRVSHNYDENDHAWSIVDPEGNERARFANDVVMAEHFAILLEHNDRLRAEVERLREKVAQLDPPRGPCGMRWHAADCDCGGVGGDR